MLTRPPSLDAALTRWERERDRDCLEVSQWTDTLARGEAMSALEVELYREAAADPELGRLMADVFSRSRRPSSVLTPRRTLRLARRALVRRGAERTATVASAARDFATAWFDWRERRALTRDPYKVLNSR